MSEVLRASTITLSHGHGPSGEAVLFVSLNGMTYAMPVPAALAMAEYVIEWAMSPCADDSRHSDEHTCHVPNPTDLFGAEQEPAKA